MKNHTNVRFASLVLFLSVLGAAAQGTAFTYQGRLFEGANSANGKYDLRLSLYDALSGGSLVAGPLTNSAVVVSNGLFTVTPDFGPGAFTGSPRFIEVAARSNTVAVAFTALAPRQGLTPTPYAITAENLDGILSASQLSGTLPGVLLSGAYSNPVTLNNPGNVFGGDGSNLIGLNASEPRVNRPQISFPLSPRGTRGGEALISLRCVSLVQRAVRASG